MHVRKALMWLYLISAAAFPTSCADASRSEIAQRLAGSEIYIDQAQGRLLEKDNSNGDQSPDKPDAKPAEGNMNAVPQAPVTCDPQNASSATCYTATQQARPIPR